MKLLDTSPSNLAALVNSSCQERDKKLDAVKERETVALGSLANIGEREESPENMAFGLFATMVGSMVSSAPEMAAMSNGGRRERIAATATASGVTQIARQSRMERPLEENCWDFWFKPFTAGFVEMAPAQMTDLTRAERAAMSGRLAKSDESEIASIDTKDDDVPSPRANMAPRPELPAHWPRYKRLNPRRCGWDMTAESFSEARFTFHEAVEHADSLIERAEQDDTWDALAVIASPFCNLMGGTSVGSTGEDDHIRYFVVYVPGDTIEGEAPGPNQPGVIYTLSSTGVDSNGNRIESQEIRKPYYFTGHPDGPHVFGGQYTTGHDAMFLNLLGANEDSLAMLEAVSGSLHQRIRDHKVVHVYDSSYEEDVQQIVDSPHGGWRGIAGLGRTPGMIQDIETGAVTPAEVAEYRELQANANRQLGISDATRGMADGDATATAVMEASQSVDAKVEYLVQRWMRFVGEALERMAFYVAMDDRVAVRLDDTGRGSVLRAQLAPLAEQGILPRQAVEQIIEAEKNAPMVFQGGDFAQGGELDWFALRIEVKPSSMTGAQSRAAVQRELAWNQQLAFMLQQMVQQPWGRWTDRIRATGRAMGMDDADIAADVDLAQQIAQVMIAQGNAQYETASQSQMSAQPARQGAMPVMPEQQGMMN